MPFKCLIKCFQDLGKYSSMNLANIMTLQKLVIILPCNKETQFTTLKYGAIL